MDRINNHKRSGRRASENPIGRLCRGVRCAIDQRKRDKARAAVDLAIFAAAAIFSRCHVLFGSHPLAIGFISVLPFGVWSAVLGAIIGSLTLGRAGIIYAMIALIVAFLRVIVSGTDTEVGCFHEGLILRMSAALIGGFTAAVYEALLSGLSLTTLLFGAAMVILPPLTVLLLFGLFDSTVDVGTIFSTSSPVLSLKGRSDKERLSVIFFQCSVLFLTLIISLSLAEYVIFGINLAYIYSSLVTLLVAKRFGAVRAAAVGFTSAVGLSSLFAVSFALLGIAAGVLFPIGTFFALFGGGAALGAWCAYAGGVGGFLSVFPEYAAAALLSAPPSSRLSLERTKDEEEALTERAEDMLGTAVLAYKSRYTGSLDRLSASLTSLSSIIGRYKDGRGFATKEELCELIDDCIADYCTTCTSTGCTPIAISNELRTRCADKLLHGSELTPSDLSECGGACVRGSGLSSVINRAAAILREEKYRAFKNDTTAESFALISRLIKEAGFADDAGKRRNEELSRKVGEILPKHGLSGGVAMVLGTERPRVMIAAEDSDGSKISSDEFKAELSELMGMRLGDAEFYRSGALALMECSPVEKLRAECAFASRVGGRDEISGDYAVAEEFPGGRFIAMIADGMGSGREARSTAKLAADFLLGTLGSSSSDEAVLKLLNLVIRSESEEYSSTVDLFSLDLVSGAASFIKSGASPSYIKRGSSLFRIRSRTAPIGVMREADAERIRAEVREGDFVIMTSDGVSSSVEDTPWLLELLSRPHDGTAGELAEKIISSAEKRGERPDDMTVAVTAIYAVS